LLARTDKKQKEEEKETGSLRLRGEESTLMMTETKNEIGRAIDDFGINQKIDGSCFKRIKSVFDVSQSKRSMIKVRHTRMLET